MTSEYNLGDDLEITKTTRRYAGNRTWIEGTLNEHRFQALVFPEHAENEDYELGRQPDFKALVATAGGQN